MKKIHLLCVGKIKEKYFTQGIEEYLKRLQKYCSVRVTQLEDYPDKADAVKRESDAILQKLSGFVILTALDGENLTSEQFSEKIEHAYAVGNGEVTLVIGGSSGVDDRVKRAAHLKVSFGKMTYPHRLMRLILCEQVYRAFTISANTPYHK